jgi:hypothetical protein
MVRRNRRALVLLVATLLLLTFVVYRNGRSILPAAGRTDAMRGFVPLAIENPALRLDLLENLRTFEYQGPRRNIFTFVTAPPPPAPVEIAPAPPAPLPPAPPPPLVIPASLVGFVDDPGSSSHRAVFGTTDDVYVVGVGDTLLNRFRLVKIDSSTVEMEELSSHRRTTLTLPENSRTP